MTTAPHATSVPRSLPATMRSWTTRGDGIDALRREIVPVPVPGPGEVLLEITARSLNYRDLLVIDGVGAWRPERPVVPLSDAVGVVRALGTEVTRFALGDRVLPAYLPSWHDGPLRAELKRLPVGGPVNRGMLADLVVVDQDSAVAAPTTLDDTEAATLPVAGVTAWHALQRPSPRPGDWVLVHGTGGVALMALQLARAQGLRTIITSGSDEKLARAQALGATATIDRRRESVAERTREITGGPGADLVLETIGGSHLDVSLDAVRTSGQISFIGVIAGQVQGQVAVGELMAKNVTLHGIETGSREMLAQLVAFVDHHRIQPVVRAVRPVDDVAAALHLLAGTDHLGKIVLAD